MGKNMPRTLLRRHDKYQARAGSLVRRRREALTAIIVIIVLMGGDIAARRPRHKAGHSLQACRRHHAITVALLLDPRQRREREVIALHRQLLGHQHVIDLAARGRGLRRILVEEAVPIRMRREHRDIVADVGLHIDRLAAG